MTRNSTFIRSHLAAASACAFAALAAPANADQLSSDQFSANRAMIGDSWPLLALDRAGGCELTIASAGHAMQLRASGLIPGEALQLVLTNGDMRPIFASAYADNRGGLVRYYKPFRFNRDGGMVRVSIAAARCNLIGSAAWNRELVTIP